MWKYKGFINYETIIIAMVEKNNIYEQKKLSEKFKKLGYSAEYGFVENIGSIRQFTELLSSCSRIN